MIEGVECDLDLAEAKYRSAGIIDFVVIQRVEITSMEKYTRDKVGSIIVN